MQGLDVKRGILFILFFCFLFELPLLSMASNLPTPGQPLPAVSKISTEESEGNSKTIWVRFPTAQRSSGEWIDDTLKSRVKERGITRYPLIAQFPHHQRVEVIRSNDPVYTVNEIFYKRGWTDGLPVIPPAIGKVEEMLRYTDRPREEVIGELDPLKGVATIEKIAVNAVMAGCRPEYFPVVLAAVEAIADPDFNLRGVQTTDENVTPLLIINGPIAKQLNINSSFGALGPGFQANATIGRAIRLVMHNIGGGWPGVVSFAGLGQPARYSLCLAEDEAISPWDPLNVELGYPKNANTVTVTRAESVINVTGGLEELASVMGSLTSAFVMRWDGIVSVILGPSAAQSLAAKGWTKNDVKRYLFEHSTISTKVWKESFLSKIFKYEHWQERVRTAAEKGQIPVLQSPEDITLIVAGGDVPITQSAYFPSWGFPPCRITKEIKLPPDWNILLKQ